MDDNVRNRTEASEGDYLTVDTHGDTLNRAERENTQAAKKSFVLHHVGLQLRFHVTKLQLRTLK